MVRPRKTPTSRVGAESEPSVQENAHPNDLPLPTASQARMPWFCRIPAQQPNQVLP